MIDDISLVLGTSMCSTDLMDTVTARDVTSEATAKDVLDPDCPSRLVLARIGDKWTLMILIALSTEVLRFSEVRTRVGGVTPKVLTQTLRALERDGLVHRQVFAVVPPRVEYRLSELGFSLLEPIQAVKVWAEQHADEVIDARERADGLLAGR